MALRMFAKLAVMAALSVPAQAQNCPPYTGETLSPIGQDFSAAAAFPDTPVPSELALALDAALGRAREATGAPAMGAAVLTRDGLWISEDGDQVFYWASVTKLVTATIIQQLVAEEVLELDEAVARYLEGVPGEEAITIRMLLAHTSGLRSANEIVQEQGQPFPATLAEELALVSEAGPLFCPGSRWRYSNTGYGVLGAIIEQVDGGEYAASVQRRIAGPLGLTSLRIVTDVDDTGFATLAPGEGQPVFHPSQAGAAGALVATPEDMARLLAGFVEGRLVDAATVAEMGRVTYPMFDAYTYYGLGLMAYRFPDGNGGTGQWIGHSGGVPGSKAVIAYDQLTGNIATVALTGDGSAEATANLLLRTANAHSDDSGAIPSRR